MKKNLREYMTLINNQKNDEGVFKPSLVVTVARDDFDELFNLAKELAAGLSIVIKERESADFVIDVENEAKIANALATFNETWMTP